jgi:hypothetical protein
LEKQLKIFYPNNSFKIHKTTIILLTLVMSIILIHYSKKIFPENLENLNILNFAVIIVTFLYFIFLLISNLFRHESENGIFAGFLIIENDRIICNNKTYLLNNIQKISILDNYYRGNFNGNIMPFESKKSNGLKNYIEISVNNQTDRYYFLQTNENNIKIFLNELTIYFEKGLLTKQNFENIKN